MSKENWTKRKERKTWIGRWNRLKKNWLEKKKSREWAKTVEDIKKKLE
ncbi:TPA: hypothetical protein HA351_01330 [Methanosarcinaceae archaeon]|nr:hypothetical protein [Methanosarcinaceae archaeon]